MRTIAFILALISSSAFAGTASKTIQVSATVLPYCRVITDTTTNTARNECLSNKSSTRITTTTSSTPSNTADNVPVVMTKQVAGNTTTITFSY